jgi:hypothetical protein
MIYGIVYVNRLITLIMQSDILVKTCPPEADE